MVNLTKQEIIILLAICIGVGGFVYTKATDKAAESETIMTEEYIRPEKPTKPRLGVVVAIQHSSSVCDGGAATTIVFPPANDYDVICEWFPGIKVGDIVEEDTE